MRRATGSPICYLRLLLYGPMNDLMGKSNKCLLHPLDSTGIYESLTVRDVSDGGLYQPHSLTQVLQEQAKIYRDTSALA